MERLRREGPFGRVRREKIQPVPLADPDALLQCDRFDFRARVTGIETDKLTSSVPDDRRVDDAEVPKEVALADIGVVDDKRLWGIALFYLAALP